MAKLTKKEQLYEDIFNIVSNNYMQVDDGQMGECEFVMDDEGRENLIVELVGYISKL